MERLKWTMFGLAGDLVEIVRQVHAEAGGEDGAVDQFAEFPGIVHDGEQLPACDRGRRPG
jgi:hypothetical protein